MLSFWQSCSSLAIVSSVVSNLFLAVCTLTCSSVAIASSEVSNDLFLAVYALSCSSLASVVSNNLFFGSVYSDLLKSSHSFIRGF